MALQEHKRAYALRGVVTADDAAIDLTAANAIHANAVEVPKGLQDFEVFFIGTTGAGTDADTNVNLYAWDASGTPTILMGTFSLTLGTQDAGTDPTGETISGGLYVDTIAADNDYWGCTITDSGNNHCCKIGFYLQGLSWLGATYANVGDTNELDTVYAYYRAY